MRCPICKKSIPAPDPDPDPDPERAPGDERPSHLPFCSDRCKLIDLGRWLDGKYQVPVEGDEGDDAADASPRRVGPP